MSTAALRAAELRDQAAALDEIAQLEVDASLAKDVYRSSPGDPWAKANHRAAGAALTTAREELRITAVAVASGQGSTTIVPSSAKAR